MHDDSHAGDSVLPPSERPPHQIGESVSAESVGTTGGGARFAGGIRDPRALSSLSARHLAVLASIGQGLRAMYQLHARHFKNKSKTPVLRTLYCLEQLGLIVLERWNRNGLLLARLREGGRQLLLSHGIPAEQIFLARAARPATLQHTLWIGDLAVAISLLPVPHEVDLCWSLRRKYPDRDAVPDLLVRRGDGRRTLAVEVDLGSENLRRVLVPKLENLDRELPRWAGSSRPAILVLMNGPRRMGALEGMTAHLTTPIGFGLLPSAVGAPAITSLTHLLLPKESSATS